MLEIKDFSFKYPNGKMAVENLNLHVESGDLYAFIGHNGAGKTTTIKSIVGILKYEKGSIFVDGKSVLDSPMETKSKISYLPDNPDLYDSLTGIQYLNFLADIYKISKNDRKELIVQYAKEFDMLDNLNNYISSYSHGMKQKLALIGAFIHKPKLLILDEPFVGLDPKASFIVKKMMREFCEQGGAIFFSTHILEVAQKLCNKMAIIKSGKLIKEGLMEEITKDSSLEEVFLELTEND